MVSVEKTVKIKNLYSDPLTDISFDTLKNEKQALIFVNSRRGAESQAERLAHSIGKQTSELTKISEAILQVLSRPTKQCIRLANCVKKGMAFHHSGLSAKQRDLVEDNFKNGSIKIIACTPTLAFGVNLPSFRTIIRDLKRYGSPHGMAPISVLEYHQMIGRSGRPDFNDKYGEAICLAKSESELQAIFDEYVHAEPEEIFSKLAVEPELRASVLSLIATGFVRDKKALFDFFDKTFYAFQFKDLHKLHKIINKILKYLTEWEFITSDETNDFVSADELNAGKLKATPLGHRVSELYLDPLTAFFIITCLRRATVMRPVDFSFLQMVSRCLEMRPLLRVKISEYETIQARYTQFENRLLDPEPSEFDPEYEEFLNAIKTAFFLYDWIDEKDEEYLLEKFNIRPGEIKIKLDIADWLLYSAEELSRLLKFSVLRPELIKLRLRLKHGAKEEVLSLLKLKNIGRVRARAMFNHKIKNITDVVNVDIMTLSQLIGKKTAISVKKQVGQEFDPKKILVKQNKRKGQISLLDY